MVATLYDESLDAFAPLNWPQRFSVFREDYSTVQSQFANTPMGFQQVFGGWDRPYETRGDHLSLLPAGLDREPLGLSVTSQAIRRRWP